MRTEARSGSSMVNRTACSGSAASWPTICKSTRTRPSINTAAIPQASARDAPLRRSWFATGVQWDDVSNTPSIASRTSPMSRMRALGSFWRQRRSTIASTGAAPDGNAPRSGALFITSANVSDTSSPLKARRPVSISYSTAPNAQMSARLSTGFPRACSGDIYAAVPMITPICVPAAVNVGDWFGSPPGTVECLGQAKVQHLHGPVRPQLDVGRLQIPVDDALFVRGFQRLRDLLGDRQRLVHRNRSLGDAVSQRRPLDQLQDQRLRAVLLQAVDACDAGVVQAGQNLRLSLKAGQSVGISRECLGEDLERDLAVELRVGRLVDLAHAALADEGGHPVMGHLGADFQKHRTPLQRCC